MKLKQLLAVPLTAVLLSACTATTSLRSSDPSLAVKINNDAPLVLKNPSAKPTRPPVSASTASVPRRKAWSPCTG
ncbi:hypothetical protein [Stutzerimonas nitrititolerans]|uniref:hypothetical protein n=1 Tax=Stutzerimonas nitrititolerans TaxID=2482751 RepID=UPI0028A17823|nr:hypothetical protein [Stutzerimonas nitrititolerans]